MFPINQVQPLMGMLQAVQSYTADEAPGSTPGTASDSTIAHNTGHLGFTERLNSAISGMLNGLSGLSWGNANPVAAGTPAMLDQAASYSGLNENKDREKLMEITGQSDIDPSKSKWCAAFAMNLMQDNKVLDTTGLSNINYTPTIKDWAVEKGIYKSPEDYTPKPGDAIMFDWDANGKKVDHIGLVKDVKDGQVTTIEGNKDDEVGERTISLDSKLIDGYVVSADVAEAAKAAMSAVNPKSANAASAAAAKSSNVAPDANSTASSVDPKSANAASAAAAKSSNVAPDANSTASAVDAKSFNAASAAAAKSSNTAPAANSTASAADAKSSTASSTSKSTASSTDSKSSNAASASSHSAPSAGTNSSSSSSSSSGGGSSSSSSSGGKK